jgi:nicotinate-nucleotide adenylyltransferase
MSYKVMARFVANVSSVGSKQLKQKRIGVFGGSFDPVHYGHLAAAEEARDALGLSQVLFVPAALPPHKGAGALTPYALRYAMVEAAVAGNPAFSVSHIEQDLPKPSYTVQTLQVLGQLHPDAELYFITGADMFLDLPTWKDVDYMLVNYHFVAVARPGWSQKKVTDVVNLRWAAYAEHIHILDVPGVAISATEIRRRVKSGRSLRYLAPDVVIEFITEHDLYK